MVKTVAYHEFLFAIKRKAFYLVTLGMPLIVLAYVGLIALIAYSSTSNELKQLGKPLAIVDHSGILCGPGGTLERLADREILEYETRSSKLDDLLSGGPQVARDLQLPAMIYKLQRFERLEDAQQALRAETVRAVVVLPADYLESGSLQHFMLKRSLFGSKGESGFLRRLIAENILRQARLPDAAVERIQRNPLIQEYERDPAGDFVRVDMWSKWFSIGLPLGISGLLLIALMMNASLLLASVAEEKENKVMEVILSSVTAEQLLFGKVLGLVAAGLLQVLIWMAMVSVVPMLTMSVLKQHFDYDINLTHLVLGGVFVVLGFIFYGCLLAGLGSMGTTYKDCQQLTVAIILCACVPFMTWTSFVGNPDGWVARSMSLIPLFSPGSMMLRLGLHSVPWWEVLLSLVLLLAGIWVALKISARLFRAGTLMYGKKPGPREIWKALRQPA